MAMILAAVSLLLSGASLALAILGLKKREEAPAAVQEEPSGDEELRQGLLNLLSYSVGERGEDA